MAVDNSSSTIPRPKPGRPRPAPGRWRSVSDLSYYPRNQAWRPWPWPIGTSGVACAPDCTLEPRSGMRCCTNFSRLCGLFLITPAKEAFVRGRPRLPATGLPTTHCSTLAMNVKVSNCKRYFHKGNLRDKITYVCVCAFLIFKEAFSIFNKRYM